MLGENPVVAQSMRRVRDAAASLVDCEAVSLDLRLFAVLADVSGCNKVPQVIEDTFIVWRCAASVVFVVVMWRVGRG